MNKFNKGIVNYNK